MAPKLSHLNIVLGYLNENMNQNFRFNNPKQFSNWIILVSFFSSHLAIKITFFMANFTKNVGYKNDKKNW
jgi:K+-transporting ATPase A subunit